MVSYLLEQDERSQPSGLPFPEVLLARAIAIYLNVDRKQAADFSFLMLLPVVLGATLLKTLEMGETGMTVAVVPLVVGTVVAYVSGIFAIRAVQVLVRHPPTLTTSPRPKLGSHPNSTEKR